MQGIMTLEKNSEKNIVKSIEMT